MSSSDSIIEGALISVGEKHETFLLIFTSNFLSFFVIIAIISYNQVIWCLLKMFNELLLSFHFILHTF